MARADGQQARRATGVVSISSAGTQSAVADLGVVGDARQSRPSADCVDGAGRGGSHDSWTAAARGVDRVDPAADHRTLSLGRPHGHAPAATRARSDRRSADDAGVYQYAIASRDLVSRHRRSAARLDRPDGDSSWLDLDGAAASYRSGGAGTAVEMRRVHFIAGSGCRLRARRPGPAGRQSEGRCETITTGGT